MSRWNDTRIDDLKTDSTLVRATGNGRIEFRLYDPNGFGAYAPASFSKEEAEELRDNLDKALALDVKQEQK
ncbi:hypothetical protein [Kineosporia succinea]|uniref:Uncharacterized protein n=1 Tax=Kineosporia succinea TaxID=84632 RepID=A0ABT9P9N1_9ACTN|nr:hypothetical protein [Kineosporia succinea]MDP9829404.1 hypothetical protein [Kineosporia succinea]